MDRFADGGDVLQIQTSLSQKAPVSFAPVPTSFHANAGSVHGVAQTAQGVVSHVEDPHHWLMFMAEVAALLNWLAMLLTLFTAMYHAYGYVQYKQTLEQMTNVHDERD